MNDNEPLNELREMARDLSSTKKPGKKGGILQETLGEMDFCWVGNLEISYFLGDDQGSLIY